MKKFIFVLGLIFLISCSQDKENSITLGVEQTVEIPVSYVSVAANIQVENTDPTTVEENGYNKLSKAVSLLEKIGYKKDQLEINSGEVRNQSYRERQSYEYNSSINFDIKELDQIDSVRRALIKNGVTSFSISSYKNANEDSLYDRAYQDAIHKAKEKAEGLIKNQQLEIGKILNLSQNVEETITVVTSYQSKKPPRINVNSELSLEPLFQKKYYEKRIEFTIEFELN